MVGILSFKMHGTGIFLKVLLGVFLCVFSVFLACGPANSVVSRRSGGGANQHEDLSFTLPAPTCWCLVGCALFGGDFFLSCVATRSFSEMTVLCTWQTNSSSPFCGVFQKRIGNDRLCPSESACSAVGRTLCPQFTATSRL